MATVNSIKPIPDLDGTAIARFWKRVEIRGPNECWPWLGASAVGYGRFYLRRKVFFSATRISYLLARGEQPSGFVCHTCDNPKCVNPKHLWIGNSAANNRDREAKRRGRNSRKTHCIHGHSLHDALVFRGMRRCRECNRLRCKQRMGKVA